MRRILLISMTAVIAGSGLAVALRSRHSASPDAQAQPFRLEPCGEGHYLRLAAGEVPIRNLAWAESEDPGVRFLQMATQNDHQYLYRISVGAPPTRIELQRPEGLPETFLRTASLQRVLGLADGTLLLHFVSEGQQADASLISRVDPSTGRSLWHRRFPGNRSRSARTPKGSTLLLHGASPQLVCIRWMSSPASPFAPTIEQMDAPGGGIPLLDALPLMDGGLLACQGRTLHRWSRTNGWQVLYTAAAAAFYPSAGTARLAHVGHSVVWQPSPGSLYSVDPAAPSEAPVPVELPMPPEPLDRPLLRLAGSDAEGRLWFDLQRPEVLPSAEPPSRPEADSEVVWKADGLTSGMDPDALKGHLARPLDRVYAWVQGSPRLQTITWSEVLPTLGTPAELCGQGLRLHPAQGLAMTPEASPAWWTPLSTLLRKASAPQPR